jgi:hypothetical protein
LEDSALPNTIYSFSLLPAEFYPVFIIIFIVAHLDELVTKTYIKGYLQDILGEKGQDAFIILNIKIHFKAKKVGHCGINTRMDKQSRTNADIYRH